MPEISLIIATLHRTDELRRLLDTLTQQSFKNFEIIIVDQNNDNRIEKLFINFPFKSLTLQHLRHLPANLAAARNIGISKAKGKWCGFPDDDCWYEPTTLERLHQRCEWNDRPHGVIARWVEQNLALSPTSLSWKKSSQFRDLPVSSISLFIHKALITQLGGFDTRLGVGQWFGAAEETDLVLRALKEQATIVYEPSIKIHHKTTDNLIEYSPEFRLQAKKRARGTGALYAKHHLSSWVIFRGLIAPILRPLKRGQFTHELAHGLSLALGRLQGWLNWRRQESNVLSSLTAMREDKGQS